MTVAADVRFAVPLYTSREAASYLGVPSTTFASWVKGCRREFAHRAPVEGAPLVTGLVPEAPGALTIPFGGLAEGMFLSALRRSGMPLQQIGPMLELVRTRHGVEHALASRRLYVVGAKLLWKVSTACDLIVLRNGQYVFRRVIEQYLQRITYDIEYAQRLELPRYEVAHVATDPEVNYIPIDEVTEFAQRERRFAA